MVEEEVSCKQNGLILCIRWIPTVYSVTPASLNYAQGDMNGRNEHSIFVMYNAVCNNNIIMIDMLTNEYNLICQ